MKDGFYILKEGECAFEWFENFLLREGKSFVWDNIELYGYTPTSFDYTMISQEEKIYQYHLPHELFT